MHNSAPEPIDKNKNEQTETKHMKVKLNTVIRSAMCLAAALALIAGTATNVLGAETKRPKAAQASS